MTELIFATGNKGKLAEVKKIFENSQFKIVSLYDIGDVPEIEETGSTFEDNAFIKAQAIYSIHEMPVIADDSGLSVEQLNGEPGVYSARFAGENCTYDDNNRKLIGLLQNFSTPHNAKFVCSAIYYDGVNKVIAVGELQGEIISEFRGSNGFGYDPIFLPFSYKKTLAELTTKEKNLISHRAKAFNDLKILIDAYQL